MSCHVLNYCLCALEFLNTSAIGDEIVSKQILQDQRTLIVTRHEVTDAPPDKPLPRGFVYAKPDHVYVYDFSISSAFPPGHLTKLWTYRFRSYGANKDLLSLPTDFKVLDAAVQGQTLVIVYKEFNKQWGGETFANVVTQTSAPPGWSAMARDDVLLTHDSDAGHVYVPAAAITGTVKDKTLAVSLKNVYSTIRYRLTDGKWAKVSIGAG